MPKWSRIRSANTRGFDVATQSVYPLLVMRVEQLVHPVVEPVFEDAFFGEILP